MKNMTSGSPMQLILRFAIPVLLGNLLQLTYSIADTRIVGGFLGDTALAAVGATAVLQSLYMGFFMGIANGFAITTAQSFGKSENSFQLHKTHAKRLPFRAVFLFHLNLGRLLPKLLRAIGRGNKPISMTGKIPILR